MSVRKSISQSISLCEVLSSHPPNSSANHPSAILPVGQYHFMSVNSYQLVSQDIQTPLIDVIQAVIVG